LVKDKHPQVNRTTPLEYKLVDTIVHKGEAQQGYWIAGVTGAEKQVYSINDRQATAMTNAFLRQNLQWGAFNVAVAIYHRLKTTGPRHGISEVVGNNGELYVCLALFAVSKSFLFSLCPTSTQIAYSPYRFPLYHLTKLNIMQSYKTILKTTNTFQ
jgi:hypothetical protein